MIAPKQVNRVKAGFCIQEIEVLYDQGFTFVCLNELTMSYILLMFLLICPIAFGYGSRVLYKISKGNISKFYFSHLLLSAVSICIFYLCDKTLFKSISTEMHGEDIKIPGFIIDVISSIFILPIILELSFFFVSGRENKQKQLIVYKGSLSPDYLLPRTSAQLFYFVLFIFENVVFEEILVRQVFFLLVYRIWNANPIIIILFSSLFFALIHFKEPIKEKLILFFEGCAFAVVFYWSKSIIVPIGLHFILNATEGIIAYKLLLWKKKDY